jgi:hypothetical protein
MIKEFTDKIDISKEMFRNAAFSKADPNEYNKVNRNSTTTNSLKLLKYNPVTT